MSKMIAKFTENGTKTMISVPQEKQGVSIVVTGASSLGGGILNLQVRPDRSNVDFETVEPLTVGQRNMFLVGANMEVRLELTGATTPDVTVFVSLV